MAAWTRRGVLTAFGASAALGKLAFEAVSPANLLATPPDVVPLPPPQKPETFRDRQTRLRAAAKAGGLDALFITPSTNLAWAADLGIGRSERLTALILLTDGPAVLVTPSFEEANHRRSAIADEVRTWTEEQDPLALTAKVLGSRKAIGVEGSTSFATATGLGAAIRTAQVREGSTCVVFGAGMVGLGAVAGVDASDLEQLAPKLAVARRASPSPN